MLTKLSSRWLGLVLAAVVWPALVAAQERERSIKWEKAGFPNGISGPEMPLTKTDLHVVEIVGFKAAGQSVTPDIPFLAGEDWLRTLSVTVRNIADKPITRLRFDFGLPEDKFLRKGRTGWPTYWVGYTSEGNDGRKDVMPGEEVELRCVEYYYPSHMEGIAKQTGVRSFTLATAGTVQATFKDGTNWIGGNLRLDVDGQRKP